VVGHYWHIPLTRSGAHEDRYIQISYS
jgi:hypothetical protein